MHNHPVSVVQYLGSMETKMLQVIIERQLKGQLADFMAIAKAAGSRGTFESWLVPAFKGELKKDGFEISMDDGWFLRFRNQELLQRWASMGHTIQLTLFGSIRFELVNHDVLLLELEVPWGENTTRRIVFRRDGKTTKIEVDLA